MKTLKWTSLAFFAFIALSCSKDEEEKKDTTPQDNTEQISVDSAEAHLKYFGYLRVDCETSYLDEVTGHVNMGEKKLENYTEDLSFDASFYKASCVKPILNIQNIFFAESDGQYGFARDIKLHWDYFKNKNKSVLDTQDITALYIAEQPVKKGISNEMLDSVCTLVKNDLPNTPLLILYSPEQLSSIEIPEKTDYVGFMQFGLSDPNADASYLSNLDAIKNKMADHQKLFIVMDAQWTPEHGQAGIDSTDMHTVVENYYTLANGEELAVGLLAYLWPGGYDDAQQLGMRDLPEETREMVIAIGKAIMVNNNPCDD